MSLIEKAQLVVSKGGVVGLNLKSLAEYSSAQWLVIILLVLLSPKCCTTVLYS